MGDEAETWTKTRVAVTYSPKSRKSTPEKLNLQKNGNFQEDEKTDFSRFRCSSCGKENIIGTRFVDAAAKNSLTEYQESKAPVTLVDGFAAISAPTQLEIIRQRLRGNACGFSADQQLRGKASDHWKMAIHKGVNLDAAGNT